MRVFEIGSPRVDDLEGGRRVNSVLVQVPRTGKAGAVKKAVPNGTAFEAGMKDGQCYPFWEWAPIDVQAPQAEKRGRLGFDDHLIATFKGHRGGGEVELRGAGLQGAGLSGPTRACPVLLSGLLQPGAGFHLARVFVAPGPMPS